MAIQQEISAALLSQMVGTQQRVVIDREEEGYYVGRTQYDSPEVDCEVLIEKTENESRVWRPNFRDWRILYCNYHKIRGF